MTLLETPLTVLSTKDDSHSPTSPATPALTTPLSQPLPSLLLSCLYSLPYFANVELPSLQSFIDSLSSGIKTRVYEHGETVVKLGDKAVLCFIIIRG